MGSLNSEDLELIELNNFILGDQRGPATALEASFLPPALGTQQGPQAAPARPEAWLAHTTPRGGLGSVRPPLIIYLNKMLLKLLRKHVLKTPFVTEM